jgi:hypothetical protein
MDMARRNYPYALKLELGHFRFVVELGDLYCKAGQEQE